MTHRWSTRIYSALLLAAGATACSAPEPCEPELARWAQVVNTPGDLFPATELPNPPGHYATCRVDDTTQGLAEGTTYLLYRDPDQITVFVEQTPPGGGAAEIFGPFYTSRRK